MREENGRKSKKHLTDVRLCVTGASNVGKSAITVRFLTRRFIGEYQRNVEQTYRGMIDFGTDTIKYELKDSSRSPDKSSLTTWATCVAVIYSITDQQSFSTASSILDDIDGVLHQTMQCKRLYPSIALIGNKKDLEHLRKVDEEDGRSLAEKHGAEFWEVSASEDYHSTFRPLNSLIIESFLNVKNGKNTTPNSVNSSPPSSGNDTLPSINVDEISKLLRRKSEPCYDTPKIVKNINSFEAEYVTKENDDVKNNNLVHCNNSPILNTIKRRRKHLRDRKMSVDKIVKKISPPASSTPTPTNGYINNYSGSPSSITIEVTDTGSDGVSSQVKRNNRSQSWSKTDKKRVIQRKSTEQKNNSSIVNVSSIPKSRSFTDLKTLVKDGIDTAPRGIVTCKSAILLTVDSDVNEGETLNDKENLCNTNSLKTTKSVSASSFSKFASIENSKNYWNRLRKERRKLLTLSLEQVYDNNNGSVKIIEPVEKSTMNGSINGVRNIGKKSVRRKISSIFRPRSISGAP